MGRTLATTKAPVGPAQTPPAPLRDNAGYPWDKFDPLWYVQHNYSGLRDDDRWIIEMVRDFFAAEISSRRSSLAGIDVGSGANLYPALSMLPFCRAVTMWERGAANVEWLNEEVKFYSPLWNEYWDILAVRDRYEMIEKPRERLAASAEVRKGNLFKLPQRSWDLGTMFFVAESISEQEREFKAAAERFIGSLKVGAPFAAAFMRDSSGYHVDGLRFPAVAVTGADVEHCLAPLVDGLEITSVLSENALREGYRGMILALGRAGKART